jgi:copper resistance protein C
VSYVNRRVLGTLFVVILFAGSMAVASAHAELESSEPAESATVPPPERVVATFTQEVAEEGSVMSVFNQDGEQVDTGDGGLDLDNLDRNVMTVSLQPDLPAGTYDVKWTTASVDDGDVHSGSFSFTVDPNAVAAVTTEATSTGPAVVAPTGTVEPADVADSGDDDDGGISRGAWIVGGVSILVALAVVASIGRRHWWR